MSPRKGLGGKMKPRWNDINNEDGVDDDNVGCDSTERNWKEGQCRAQSTCGKLFWIKMNSKGLIKVSKSQLTKVRRHNLT